MKTIIIIGLIIVSSFAAKGQPTYFSKLYDIANYGQLATSVVELPGQGYVAVGDDVTPVPNHLLHE